MKRINDINEAIKRPIKILQFGEGNFLRAFVDYYFQKMNDHNNFNGNVAIIKSINQGCLNDFVTQDNLYTVILRGKHNEKIIQSVNVIDCIGAVIDIYNDYESYISFAASTDLQIIISNTTEAGIEFNSTDSIGNSLDITYPAKLTKFLLERFRAIGKAGGLYIIPCELIDNNADKLKKCVDNYIDLWDLPKEFKHWNNNNNYYCNSLVDRIVTGFPKKDLDKIYNELGYVDKLITTAEPFGLWVIENKGNLQDIFPYKNLDKIIFTNKVEDYKLRKVRLLNGAHTSMVPVAFLSGLETVKDCMSNDIISKFIKEALFEEIIESTHLDREELRDFAKSVLERFENPFIEHMLLSIALNSISKWRVRVLPSLKAFVSKYNRLPHRLIFSLACLIKMYKGKLNGDKLECNNHNLKYQLSDEYACLKFFSNNYNEPNCSLVRNVLSNKDLFGEDLLAIQGVGQLTLEYYDRIDKTNANIIDIVGEINEKSYSN